jgi:Fe-S-cluster containining protein
MHEQIQETLTVELGIGDGKFSVTAVVPAGQTNLTQILPVLQSLDDSVIARTATQLSETGQTISCKAGCGACCRHMVSLSLFEAEALCAWIRTLPESRQQELARRFHDAFLKLADAGIIDRMAKKGWLTEGDAAARLILDYLYQRIPCPFLEDERCSIYPIRPLICREHLVTSAPQHCVDPAKLQVAPVYLPLNLSEILNVIGAEVEQGDSPGWIPLIFLFAWMEGGARPGEAISGPGRQVLYEFVKRSTRLGPRSLSMVAAANAPAGGSESLVPTDDRGESR